MGLDPNGSPAACSPPLFFVLGVAVYQTYYVSFEKKRASGAATAASCSSSERDLLFIVEVARCR